MPVVPTYAAKEQLDPNTRGMPNVRLSGADAAAKYTQAQALQGLGGQINGIAEHFQAKQEQQAKFDAGVQDDIRRQEMNAVLTQAQNEAPVNGVGFHDSVLPKLDEIAEKRFASMDPTQAERYRAQYQAERIGWQTKLAETERGIGSRYQSQQIDRSVQQASTEINQNPAAADALHERVAERIRDAPYLTAAEKQDALLRWERTARTTEALTAFRANPIAASRELGIPLSGVKGFEAALVNRESSGNPKVVNSFGYAGLYQMGAPLLQTLGLYTPGQGEDMGSWSKSRKDASGKWSGSFNIPGFPQVHTLQDFLNTPGAQKAAFNTSTDFYDQKIAEGGLDRFIGKEVKGVPITREGIYAMMHLGGVGGAAAALNGRGNAADANGSTVLSYAKMAADANGGGKPNPKFAALDLNTRQKIVFGALSDEQKADQASRQQAQVDQYATNRLINDDVASIRTTGKSIDEALTPERVQSVLGPAKAAEWQDKRNLAQNVYLATQGIESLPSDQIDARLAKYQPGPEDASPGFSQKAAVYKELQEKADEVLKKRFSDPAAAVADADPVKNAKLRLATDKSPQAYEGLVDARLAAQDMLGISKFAQRAIPIEEAQQYAAMLRPLARGQADAANQDQVIEGVVNDIQNKYGTHAKDVLQNVLYQVTLKRDASEVLAAALTRMTKTDSGPIVTTEEVKKVETESWAGAFKRWTGGGASAADRGFAEAQPYTGPNYENTGNVPLFPNQAPASPSAGKGRSYTDALDMLQSDPGKYLIPFAQKFGDDRVPVNLRGQLNDMRKLRSMQGAAARGE